MVTLWTEKYRPPSAEGIIGNRKAVDEVRQFLQQPARGRPLLVAGPPGCGKTLTVELVSQELGLHLMEINASDDRAKEDIEGYRSATRTQTLFSRGKVILLDEVDGLAAGDRGGVGAIVDLARQSRFPVVAIANDPYLPKLKPLRLASQQVKFTRVPTPSLEKFLREVAAREGLQAPEGTLKSLARFAEGDVRAALIDLQSAALAGQVTALESVGYREREADLYKILPGIFHASTIASSRRLVYDADKDPDEIFWWLAQNLEAACGLAALPQAYDLLARADLFRALVIKQQNWKFKGYMVDLMVGVGLHGREGYVPFQAPDRFTALARSKMARAERDALCARLGSLLHCSRRAARQQLPYLRMMRDLGLPPEDAALLAGT
ncbi:MAG: replication factor C large subunit [Candidatus Aenigmarchaeota archaeon]|nr:replication factor C large subunit [Candidatus Aenigmarchaeota archaeon]